VPVSLEKFRFTDAIPSFPLLLYFSKIILYTRPGISKLQSHAVIIVLQCVKYRTAGLAATGCTVYCRYGCYGDLRLETGWSWARNTFREAGYEYLRCSWLMCQDIQCRSLVLSFFVQNAKTQLQIYSRTAEWLTFLQKLRHDVHIVFSLWQGSVRSLKIAVSNTKPVCQQRWVHHLFSRF
jgi:hypothetical protein